VRRRAVRSLDVESGEVISSAGVLGGFTDGEWHSRIVHKNYQCQERQRLSLIMPDLIFESEEAGPQPAKEIGRGLNLDVLKSPPRIS
jgi:hypothetical protein